MRLAVLGLYNSGSTALAGMLHRLGVNMGPRFWLVDQDGSEDNCYEPYDLSWHLRRWWDEPRIVERVTASYRVRFLRHWGALQECVGAAPVGGKHPLLSLCGPDLVTAWGPDTRFIWSYRPLDESVAGLKRRGWFRGYEDQIQQQLWDALHRFEACHANMVKLHWTRVKSDPAWAAWELASLAGLQPSDSQLQAAAGFIREASTTTNVPMTSA